MKLKPVNYHHKEHLITLSDLIKDIWKECFCNLIEDDTISHICYFIKPEVLKREMKEDGIEYYFITLKREIVGYFSYSFKENSLYLSRIYFLKEYRYYGLGKCILDEIKKVVIENNLDKIFLYVDIRLEETISIFESWGFKNVKQVARYIGRDFWFRNYRMEYLIKP